MTNFNKSAKKFQCSKCPKLFKRKWNMKKRYNICYNRTKHVFPGGFYSLPVTSENIKHRYTQWVRIL